MGDDDILGGGAAPGAASGIAAAVRGLVYRYDAGAPALSGVDLDVEAGAVTALIGANGSGKTTLLRILAGVLRPTAGTVRVLGVEGPAPPGTRTGRQLRRRVGYVSQDPALDPEMTAGETLTLLAALQGVGRTERPERVAALAGSFGLGGRLDRRVEALSGGERRRLHLAAGMVHDPELLCLDEPAAGLDPEGRAFLWAEIGRRAALGRSVVIVTHDLSAVAEHAGAVAVLDAGRLLAAGPPRDLAAGHPPDLGGAYRRLTGREPEALEPRRRRRGRRR